jgi:hypothetical protein
MPKGPPVDLDAGLDELEAEEEDARLATLTHEQLLDEMKRDGLDPERGRAAVRRALEAAMGSPPQVTSLAAARARRGSPVAWIAFAAAAAAAVTIGAAANRKAIEAWLHPAPTAPPGPWVPPAHEETPLEKAGRLRESAYVNNKKGYYGDALDELDEAAKLDPAGEQDAQVILARSFATSAKHHPTSQDSAKGPLGPGERPLKRTPPR